MEQTKQLNFSGTTAMFLWLIVFPVWCIIIMLGLCLKVAHAISDLFHAPGDLWEAICEAQKATESDAPNGE